MSELELRPMGPGTDLVAWAYDADKVYQVAKRLASTAFVPSAFMNKPDDVAGAILAGRELGLGPMASLRVIDVIEGKPALSSHGLRGLLRRHGHEVWVEESTETRAIVCGQRKGEDRVQKSTWTMDRAKKAGLAGKKNWTMHPTAMLIARATAEVCRLVAPDVLLGMPHSVEELSDEPNGHVTHDEPAAAKPTTKATRTIQRAPAQPPALAAAAAPPPLVVPEGNDGGGQRVTTVDLPVETDPPPDVPPMTEPQRRKLFALYAESKLKDRAARHQHATRVLGRAVSSFTDLTVVDAAALIDALELQAGVDGPEAVEDPAAGRGTGGAP